MTSAKVLIFSDDPVAVAYMVVNIETVGPFLPIPVTIGTVEDVAGFPDGTVAVVALGGGAPYRDALFAELRERQIPVIILGSFNTRESVEHHFRSVTLPNPVDYDVLGRQILDLTGNLGSPSSHMPGTELPAECQTAFAK